MSQDEHLVAISVASNPQDLQEESRTLREEGCAPGVDYVLTSAEDGVLGPLPRWLAAAPTREGPAPKLWLQAVASLPVTEPKSG